MNHGAPTTASFVLVTGRCVEASAQTLHLCGIHKKPLRAKATLF